MQISQLNIIIVVALKAVATLNTGSCFIYGAIKVKNINCSKVEKKYGRGIQKKGGLLLLKTRDCRQSELMVS